MRCHVCQSVKHFATKCPHRGSSKDANVISEKATNSASPANTEEANLSINITLLSEKSDVAQYHMMVECIGYGVLDTTTCWP